MQINLIVTTLFILSSCIQIKPVDNVEEKKRSAKATLLEKSSLFYFSKETGRCINEFKEEGYNKQKIEECGDMSGEVLEEANLKEKTLYGLNLKGSSVLKDSKVSFKNIADTEMRVDTLTYFEKHKNPFTSLYDQHLSIMRREQNIAKKLEVSINKERALIEKYKSLLLDSNTKENKKTSIKKKLLSSQEKLTQKTNEFNIAFAKQARHRDFAKWTYLQALNEPAYKNPKISNKKFLELVGGHYLEGASSSEYFSSNHFSISIWFRTLEDQNDTRMVNFHHNSSPQTAINLSLKKGTIIAGYRDIDKNYHELKYSISYNTNDWFNIIITYNDSEFILYVNGKAVVKKIDTFTGFGAYPLMLGSYEGKSRFFNGDLDEFSIWSESLGARAVEAIYFDGIPTNLKRHLDSQHLKYWWRLGDSQSKKQSPKEHIDRVKSDLLIYK